MTVPEWTKPGAFGAVGGATILSVLGFTWGGWVWPEVEMVITILFVSVSLPFLYALPTSAQSMPESTSAQRYGDGWDVISITGSMGPSKSRRACAFPTTKSTAWQNWLQHAELQRLLPSVPTDKRNYRGNQTQTGK
ncbi:hypothetical protein [Yoonia sp.]|uniref:hypothetical protein n=1 Tax=Yoonia sp. TaxID=2212373 RepID=UPI003976BCBA